MTVCQSLGCLLIHRYRGQAPSHRGSVTTVRPCNAVGYAGPSVRVSYAIGALITLLLMGAVMITTYFTEAFKVTLVFGVPFLLILSAVYCGFFRKGRVKASNRALA